MENTLGPVIRVAILYIFVLAVVRGSGKRTIAALAPMDIVVVFAIGDMFDDIIWANVSLATGFTVIVTIAVLHVLNSYLGYRSNRFDRLVSGRPVVLVERGRLRVDGLAQERVSRAEFASMLREKEVEDLGEIKEARLELNGQLSVIKTENAKDAQKSDKDRLKDRVE